MGGSGKILSFERFEFLLEFHKFITCLPTIISSKRGGVGQKSLLFFSNNYQFQMMLFFLLFILNLVNSLYYMEIKSNNSNYRQISSYQINYSWNSSKIFNRGTNITYRIQK